jgi:hypothetical protein
MPLKARFRDPGAGSVSFTRARGFRENAGRVGRSNAMGCEPDVVTGRPCD